MVHFVTPPLGWEGVCGDGQPLFPVSCPDGLDVSAETRIGARWNEFSIGQGELGGSTGISTESKTLLMHQPMVPPAQQQQIVHRGLTAIHPVLNVMGIDETAAVTARETAATVPAFQCTPDGWWNGAGFAADVEGLAVFIVMPVHHRAVTGHAPGCFR